MRLGHVLRQRGDFAGAQANYERALAIMRQVDDRREEGIALSGLGDVLYCRRDLAGAEVNYKQSLTISQQVGTRQEEGVALFKLGQIAAVNGAHADAEEYYRQGLAVVREVHDVASLATGARIFGAFLISQCSKHDEGCELLQEAISLYSGMGLQAQAEEARKAAQHLGCLA
jgi:tetratricopeptide (TPR) repeat protein